VITRERDVFVKRQSFFKLLSFI